MKSVQCWWQVTWLAAWHESHWHGKHQQHFYRCHPCKLGILEPPLCGCIWKAHQSLLGLRIESDLRNKPNERNQISHLIQSINPKNIKINRELNAVNTEHTIFVQNAPSSTSNFNSRNFELNLQKLISQLSWTWWKTKLETMAPPPVKPWQF